MTEDFEQFRALSARLGSDPLQVQGPGGNTSIKDGDTMWIKASGTELADAQGKDIFVQVDTTAARAEAQGDGDGSCKDTVIGGGSLRPSIETTFHAMMDWPVVAHTHSIATLTHGVSPEGREVARGKLSDLPAVFVPYAKPGLPLTREITARADSATQVIVLENHGLVCCGPSVEVVSDLVDEVERRLRMPALREDTDRPDTAPPDGFAWTQESWMARDPRVAKLATAGSYYPDHVVFLGPALPKSDHAGTPPAILVEGQGVALRDGATSSQRAMLRCLSDLMRRLPDDWTPDAIGEAAEAELLNWDAEKYRQALAARA